MYRYFPFRNASTVFLNNYTTWCLRLDGVLYFGAHIYRDYCRRFGLVAKYHHQGKTITDYVLKLDPKHDRIVGHKLYDKISSKTEVNISLNILIK